MIDVCTPQHLHRDLVIAAAQERPARLSEKPLATTPRDAWAMVAAAEAAGTTLAIMHNYLLFSEVARTLEILASGEIGPVEVVILNWLGVPDSPGNAAYRPTWRHDPQAAGGGVLMDMLHIVYLAEAMLGAPIERVSAWVTARTDGAPVEDIALARFETADAAALVNVGWGVGMGGVRRVRSGGPDRDHLPRRQQRWLGAGGTLRGPRPKRSIGGQRSCPTSTVPCRSSQSSPKRSGPENRRSRPGSQGAHILETTLAVYASAATGRAWDLPLREGDPIYERGVAGLAELDLAPSSPIRRKRIFGIG